MNQKTAVHRLGKVQIIAHCLKAMREGKLFDISFEQEKKDFLTSIDRFADIAVELRESPKVLDVGSSTGILAAILKFLGHEVYTVDFFDQNQRTVYTTQEIFHQVCNVEADRLPFDDDSFDAVCCCQTLEHFTHAHLPPVLEMKRVLRPGGLLEIDVPNAVGFRNRLRVLRGKHLTWDYEKHYLNPVASVYKGKDYYPDRHNRELTKKELECLYRAAGFVDIKVRFIRDETVRAGLKKFKSIGSSLRNLWPAGRKTLMGIAKKPFGVS